jgi:hypothetical protein
MITRTCESTGFERMIAAREHRPMWHRAIIPSLMRDDCDRPLVPFG